MNKTLKTLTSLCLSLMLLCAAYPLALADHHPRVYASRSDPKTDEAFQLIWDFPEADECSLWSRRPDSDYQFVANVKTRSTDYKNGFSITHSDGGDWIYSMMVRYGDQWEQTDELTVHVQETEAQAVKRMESERKNNTWNVLIMVYRNVRIGSYRKSFTDEQISAIRWMATYLRFTMEGLSGGKMKIGTIDVVVVDEPVTSASGDGSPSTLVYGPDGDVDFSYILDHKDINLVAVFAPLLGMNGGYDWLGLGGGYLMHGKSRVYTVIINDIDTSRETYAVGGNAYPLAISALVHEMLHAVETNSTANGYSAFQPLHHVEENGYRFENGNLDWYRDLMSNTLKNGKAGFAAQSYYVSHRYGLADNGTYTDSDGVTRRYQMGIPR